MKQRIILFTACCVAIALPACSGMKGNPGAYVRPATTILALTALEKEKTDAAREALAEKLQTIGQVLQTITDPATTAVDVETAIIGALGTTPRNVALAAMIGVAFEENRASLPGQVQKVLLDMSSGLMAAAKPFLPAA